MVTNNDGVTPAVLLQHMQGMEEWLIVRIDDAKTELKGDIRRVETKVDMALVQIGNIDERLDDLEVVKVSSLKKAVGINRDTCGARVSVNLPFTIDETNR